MFVTPNLGMIGVFQLFSPFKDKLLPNTVYRCIAIRKLEDYLTNGQDPFELVYAPSNLSNTKYQEDLEKGVVTVTLQAIGTHEVLVVPNSYIEKLPLNEGTAYTVMGLGLTLGALPNDTDLTYLKERLTVVVKEVLGVETKINSLALSATVLKSQTEHESILAARELLIQDNPSDRALYLKAQEKLDALQIRFNELEAWVTTNQSSP